MLNNFKVNEDSLVLTHNDLNKITFPNFNRKELDLLYAMIISLYNKEDETVTASFTELTTAADLNYMELTHTDFIPWMKKFADKAAATTCPMSMIDKTQGEKYIVAPFFSSVIVTEETGTVEFKINKSFEYIIKKQKREYTAFTFGEFKALDRKYPKLLYRQLMQWKTQGHHTIMMKDIYRVLDCPDYNAGELRRTVLNPTIRQLKDLIPGLKFTPQKNGRTIIGYEFTWDAAYFRKKQVEEVSEKKAQPARKAKKRTSIPASEFTKLPKRKILDLTPEEEAELLKHMM